MEQPIVSFVIPIYRVEPYLEQCVDSVLAQNIRNCEVILVDDGSPDRCGEIADRYGAADSRVKVIHKRNEGLGMARNSGIAAAGGKYLCFVDSDDWLETPGLEAVIESAERYEADIAVSGFHDWDPAKHCEVYVPPPLPEGVYSHREILEGFWLPMIGAPQIEMPAPARKHWCTAWRGIYRRDFVRANNLWFPSEREQLVEDLPFNFVAYYRAGRMCMCDTAYYHYRFNEKSLVNIYRENTVERYLRMRSFLLAFAKEAGTEPAVSRRLKARDYILVAYSISGILSPELHVNLAQRFRLADELVHAEELRSVFEGVTIRELRAPRLAKLLFVFVKYRLPSFLILVFLLRRWRLRGSNPVT